MNEKNVMNAEPLGEEDLFDAARLISDRAKRRAFLESACGNNRALVERVEGLVLASSQAEEFFADTSRALHATGLPPDISRDVALSDSLPVDCVQLEEQVGTRIERYKLLQKLGEGGCGVIYMAEQEEPVRRRVALKVIKLGMETKSVIARFEAERQALAMMDHPNIARVFDAGATDKGRPYFVMELVRGVRITEFADKEHLSTSARLKLFIQVCHAIQHAHQKGIIHGDIKPSNILVTLHDGSPVPKVIDFGISKATEARLSDRFLFTAHAQLVGTPAYMSPEQAEMSGLDIDTRSDIYSLGVVLYELLTGRTPFDGKELLKGGIDEMRRTLREKEPPRPSALLHTLSHSELTRTAELRREQPPTLTSFLKGDLDWVVMKALEKDRGRRYETSNGLAMDVQRYLNNEPVLARPPSGLYRFKKLVRRNRVMFAAGGAVAAALVAGTSTSTYLFLREREARQRAVAAEHQQARLRADAELRQTITQAALLVSQQRMDEADLLLKDVAIDQPSVEGAAVLRALGEWHVLNGRWVQAASCFERLLRVDLLDGSDVTTLDYLRCGPVLIELGDFVGYDRFRQEAIARYGSTNCQDSDRIIKISLLSPGGAVVNSLAPVAAFTVGAVTEAEQRGDGFQAAWRSLAVALYEYRRGDHHAAIDWAKRCLAYPETNAPRNATARMVLAMAYKQLGRTEESLKELSLSGNVVEAKYRSGLDAGTPVQGFWFDWAFARILLKEATAVVHGPSV